MVGKLAARNRNYDIGKGEVAEHSSFRSLELAR